MFPETETWPVRLETRLRAVRLTFQRFTCVFFCFKFSLFSNLFLGYPSDF